MTEQEQIISDFKVRCEEITSKKFTGLLNSNTDQKNIIEEINDEANEVINSHSNMPNINAADLKADIDKIVQIYQNKLTA
jgi:ElaB/YqjD/DUF883 family membrane-anchored ribosome-binding protein